MDLQDRAPLHSNLGRFLTIMLQRLTHIPVNLHSSLDRFLTQLIVGQWNACDDFTF